MNTQELEILIKDLAVLPKECEWVEFKVNNSNPQEIGEYISALSNSACYHKKEFAYLVFGIDDSTHRLVGTEFRPLSVKKGNQELENWLVTQLNPRIDVNIFETEINKLHYAIFKIQATRNTIADTIKSGLIKDYDSESKSRKYAKYVPYWF
ncbi:MAG: ATP-binding protein [Bacteroidales bacterium]|nr:ATP-binding protein [Bacteroidales bacterium]